MSYSPKYTQNIIWVAEYNDGSILREWDEEGKAHAFSEINRSKLKRFHLISKDSDYYYDCTTGFFNIDGREFIFPLAGSNLNFAEGLIQYKDASTEFIPEFMKDTPYDGFEILSYNFGWKVANKDVKCQVILHLPERNFTIELTMLSVQKTFIWNIKV